MLTLLNIKDWGVAFWASFHVAQNAKRLRLLRILAFEASAGYLIDNTNWLTLQTYCNIIDWFLGKHPQLETTVFQLDEAIDLQETTNLLVGIGEELLYGADKSTAAT